jgi:hypothetical protein
MAKFGFPEKVYVNFKDPDTRLFATENPRGFCQITRMVLFLMKPTAGICALFLSTTNTR